MIDQQTINRIKEAADILDVVSEFVTLRKSGANYKGLCPFHEEKTPSFFVSPARGTCHCFGCGKGGNAVGFVMEHEQMTYPEALRWLAAKYHIEINEKELTPEEQQEQSRRESMFVVNAWAERYFMDTLRDHPDGQAFGMAYFKSRGYDQALIQKFRLGYALPDRKALAEQAQKEGYKPQFLTDTGLCYATEDGLLIDRFAGRVIFPWITVSGKTVAFGGRLLDSRTKGVNQKYVNSPDSDIYHKDRQLYGIYQAKKAIAREDCVYLVEGYTDVISMHRAGIENVVANSGTALSRHQISILHRFTANITLIYDGDEAGRKAALRGTDMLLEEGLNVRVLPLPEGEDPDSFATTHTADEFRDYVARHSVDFIRFKTALLLEGESDPAKRSQGITSIVESISLVPNRILRDTYLHDCAAQVRVAERTLIHEMNAIITARQATQRMDRQEQYTQQRAQAIALIPDSVETLLTQLIVKHGGVIIYEGVEDGSGGTVDLSVAAFVSLNLEADSLRLTQPIHQRILHEAVELTTQGISDTQSFFVHHGDPDIAALAARLTADDYLHAEMGAADDVMPADDEEALRAKQAFADKIRARTEHIMLDFRKAYVREQMQHMLQLLRQQGMTAEQRQELMTRYRDLQLLQAQLQKYRGR